MNKLYLILSILLFSIYSCKKNDQAINMAIEGVVLDSQTTQPVSDVKAEIITDNKTHTAMTDETGYYNLGKFTIGDYTIIFSKEGYATQTQRITAPDNLSAGNFGYNIVKSTLTYLNPATDVAELTIYRQFENGEPVAAQNFPCVISTGDINSTIEDTTDANGRISLKNVPQVFNIAIDYVENGIRYQTNTRIDIRQNNYIIVYGYYPEASLGIASANILDADGQPIQDFAIDGNIILQFTIPVDTSSAQIDLLENAWTAVNYIYSWSNNNMTFEINPVSNLKSNTLYSVDMQLESASKMQTYNKSINFMSGN